MLAKLQQLGVSLVYSHVKATMYILAVQLLAKMIKSIQTNGQVQYLPFRIIWFKYVDDFQ